MPVGISFGSATSGAGFDVTSTVNSIMALQRAPESAWASRTSALQTQDTALTALGTNVSALSTALSALTSFDGAFSQMQGASSDTTAVALTSVGATAQAGTHTLSVQHLATVAQQYSGAVAASATLSGTLTLQKASSSEPTTITITPGATLRDLAAQINASSAGVRATLLSDGSGQHLSLQSQTSGAGGDLSITSNAQDSGGNALSFTVAQSGTDACYTLDGVALTSGANAVSGVLQGVAFQLTGATNTNTTVQIAPDTSGIVTALQNVVSAYNKLGVSLTAQEGKDSSGNAQPLFGSTVVSEVQSALSSAFAFQPPENGAGLTWSTLGLSLGLDGTLSLDTGALTDTLANNFGGASATFLPVGSFGQNLAAALSGIGSTGTGSIALALGNNSSEESQLAANKTALEARLATYQTNLTTELTTANQILQAIPQQINEINQMFYSISGYKNG